MDLPYEPTEPENRPPTGTSGPRPREDLPHRTGRIHIRARQRGADAAALATVALHLPHMAASLTVVFVASYAVDQLGGPPWWIPLGCWAVSGALVFHRPFERLIARRLFELRHPTPDEDRTLRSVWREVTARAGVDGGAYQLWVEESHMVNAAAAAGHIVGVTSHSLAALPPAQLAGVLAHELGHHTRGHAWATLLVFWYALPGRATWQLLRLLASRVHRLSPGATAAVVALAAAVLITLTTVTYGLVFLPLATPYLAAALSRRAELRADEHAASLGFASQLMAVLQREHADEAVAGAATTSGTRFEKQGVMTRLLDSHPDMHTRIHHLQAYLEKGR
ncbi:M48 family metalloprotease [Streptomyces sp. NPDC051684]|uniref:M48 family metalloprotease n=1 Tax=Streptomyces sp. NPDC051684 TaxID=3365670 RepID=UPI0037958327